MSVMRADAGELVESVGARAIREARQTGSSVTFEHNDVEVTAHPDSRLGDLYLIWWLRRRLLQASRTT